MKSNWKPLELPKENCAFLGTLDDGRILCDAFGDDVSPEFCHYCRYFSKTYGIKPLVFARKFSKFLTEEALKG